MTPDEAAAPLILEWNAWNAALRETHRDLRGIHRGTGSTQSVAADLRYLMSAIQDHMAKVRGEIDEVIVDTSSNSPGSEALVHWRRQSNPRTMSASRPVSSGPAVAAVPRADRAPPRTEVPTFPGAQVVKGFFDEWRLANRLASVAEQQVFLASLAAIEASGPPPTPEEVANAKRLRDLANDLLAIGMKAMDDRVAKLRRR